MAFVRRSASKPVADAPSPVAPSPVAPSSVAAPTDAPSPIAPSPIAPSPVAPSPIATPTAAEPVVQKSRELAKTPAGHYRVEHLRLSASVQIASIAFSLDVARSKDVGLEMELRPDLGGVLVSLVLSQQRETFLVPNSIIVHARLLSV